MEDQIFYVGQKALVTKDDKILVLYRDANTPDLPGGKVQVGELDLAESLKREVKEETGLDITVGSILGSRIMRFSETSLEHPNKKTDYLYIVLHQVLSWSGDITLSSEHTAYKWVGRDDWETLPQEMMLIRQVCQAYFADMTTHQL